MKPIKTAILAGAAAFVLAGAAYAASQAPALHTMTVTMPDGGTATISYSGNVAPKVRIGGAPEMAAFWGGPSPFAALDRISAEMDQQMWQLERQAAVMAMPPWNANPLFAATLQGVPAGSSAYALTAVSAGSFCMRSMQITPGAHGKPHIVSRTVGNCAAAGQPGLVSAPATQAAQNRNPLIAAADRADGNAAPQFRVATFTPR
ncbi:MAG: hypothetical protein KGR48_16770 [Alphaproteobacteria bacterium]|nr:hypothetical protein [Alphaproteobacteria bacterium]